VTIAPSEPPDAEFFARGIDYSSNGSAATYTPAAFLNHPKFFSPSDKFDPNGSLDNTFIEFKGQMFLKAGANKFALRHDDGVLLVFDDRRIGTEGTVLSEPGSTSPVTTPFEVQAPSTGYYSFTLSYGECCSGAAALAFLVNDAPVGKATLMDSAALVVTFGFLAFMVERLTNGISILLGYWGWWRTHMESLPGTDEVTRSHIDRNRRVALFAMSLVLSVVGALLTKLNLLSQVSGLAGVPEIAGSIVSGLVIAAGADPIRELLNLKDRRDEGRESRQAFPSPVQVTGTLIIQQGGAAIAERKDKPGAAK
jgi:hypothetical protein